MKNVTSTIIGTFPDWEDLLVMTLPTYHQPWKGWRTLLTLIRYVVLPIAVIQ